MDTPVLAAAVPGGGAVGQCGDVWLTPKGFLSLASCPDAESLIPNTVHTFAVSPTVANKKAHAHPGMRPTKTATRILGGTICLM